MGISDLNDSDVSRWLIIYNYISIIIDNDSIP